MAHLIGNFLCPCDFSGAVIELNILSISSPQCLIERLTWDWIQVSQNTPHIFYEVQLHLEQQANFGWSTEWSQAKANRVLPRECLGHSRHPLPTIQEKTLHRDITRWSTPKSDWLYSLQLKMEKFFTVSESRLGADCGSDHELLIAKFRLKLKKVGKTTKPFNSGMI